MKSPVNDNQPEQWSDGTVTAVAWTMAALVMGLFWTGIGWMATSLF